MNLSICILRIPLNDQWVRMTLMGGFARIGKNEITILVNDVKNTGNIKPQKAQQT